MEEGALAKAPIWTDLRSFPTARLRGFVEVVTAGFPCQPVSVAGKRHGEDDERWLWDDVWRVVREVGARYLFVENVPGLLSKGFATIVGDLAAGGWIAEWDCVPAAAVGAPHRRDRVFLLAAHPSCSELRLEPGGCCGEGRASEALTGAEGEARAAPDPQGSGLEGGGQGLLATEGWAGRPAPEPTLRGVDDGLSRQVDRDRLFLLGNAVVPQAAEAAFRTLWGRLHGR